MKARRETELSTHVQAEVPVIPEWRAELVSVAGMVGVDTAAFVGVLAAAGLAIGLALQGSLGDRKSTRLNSSH